MRRNKLPDASAPVVLNAARADPLRLGGLLNKSAAATVPSTIGNVTDVGRRVCIKEGQNSAEPPRCGNGDTSFLRSIPT